MWKRTPIKAFVPRGGHEPRIRAQFGARARFDGAAPVFDQPLFLLGFYNRSGSNLLAEYLRSTRKFSGFGENLNADLVRTTCQQEQLASFPDYIAWHMAERRKPGTCYGFKASSDQVAMLLRLGIDRMFTGLRILHIWREDALGQAISAQIAWQTQKWTSSREGNGRTPRYDAKAIIRFMHEIADSQRGFSLLGSGLGLPVHHLTYESLIADAEAEITRVGSFLGVDLAHWKRPAKTALQKQADSLNETFRKRFMQEAWSSVGRQGPLDQPRMSSTGKPLSVSDQSGPI